VPYAKAFEFSNPLPPSKKKKIHGIIFNFYENFRKSLIGPSI